MTQFFLNDYTVACICSMHIDIHELKYYAGVILYCFMCITAIGFFMCFTAIAFSKICRI